MQFAWVNKSKRISDDDVAFMAKAYDAQAQEAAAAYDMTPIPVAFYKDTANLPTRNCIIAVLVDELDVDGALGYHADELGVIYIRVLVQDLRGTQITGSHEILEAGADPTCNVWKPMPGGRRVAFEISDPVEGDAYPVEVTIMGETRTVWLSNYVLPRWFDPAATGPFDRMGTTRAPFQMTEGGYLIVRDKNGNETEEFARLGRERYAAKRSNPDSRLRRRTPAAA